jgi:ATP-binding cassette subfamily B multidrug efflux pump
MISTTPSDTSIRDARVVRQPMDPGASSSAGSTLRLYLRHHRRSLLTGAVLTIVGALVSTVPPALIGALIDHLGAQADFYIIVVLGLATVALTALQALFQATGRYLTAVTARDIEFEMRDDLFHHLQRQDLAYFQHQRIGDLMARMTNDLNAVRMMLAMGIYNLVQTVAVVVFVVVAMAGLSVQLTVISLVILPFVSLTLAVVGGIVHSRFERLQAQFSDISTAAQENLSGVRVVKAFAQESAEIESFRGLCNQYLARAIGLAKADEFIWPAMEGILGLATLLVLVVGSEQAINGQLSLGQLVQFVAYLRLLAWPLVGLGWVSNLFQSGWASLKRLQDLWLARPNIHDEPDPTPDPIRGDIEFRNVSFAYADTPVLRNVSFSVPAGTSLAIVGSIGSGKSSLVNLIPRLFDVTDGQVLVDGVDVRRHSLSVLRRAVGYVPQETFLFSAPLRTNVGFGHSHELSEHELNLAGDISQLNNDVMEFPDRYDTIIGERGVTLSGGQKQRAAIARAVAKDPRILVMDDSLSAVDTHTEAEILRRLTGVKRSRTSVVVAHRISTVKDSDQILVLAAGEIVERGTHAELLARRGLYLQMYLRQQLEDEFGITPDPNADEVLGLPEGTPA